VTTPCLWFSRGEPRRNVGAKLLGAFSLNTFFGARKESINKGFKFVAGQSMGITTPLPNPLPQGERERVASVVVLPLFFDYDSMLEVGRSTFSL